MPLGNLTSQFFANVYLNELDYFVKHQLKAKYYIRYVDDFILLHQSKGQLSEWKKEINIFLKENLKIELHPDKSRVLSLGKATPFLGFRICYHYKLLKRFNRKSILRKLKEFQRLFSEGKLDYDKIYESMQGSFAYMNHANAFQLRIKIDREMEKNFPTKYQALK